MDIKELRIYKSCLEFEERIWIMVLSWDSFPKETIGMQLVRSSDSVSSNIAEGYGRNYNKDNRRFCFYAKGSLMETRNWIFKAGTRKLIDQEEYSYLINEISTIHRMLNVYINSIPNK